MSCVTTKTLKKSYSDSHASGICWIGDRILIVAFITTEPDSAAFGAALSFAQSLSAWALVIIAGSVITLVGTSYYRPAYLFTTPTDSNIAKLREAIRADCLNQITMMQRAIGCFSLWLLVYMMWWLLSKDKKQSGRNDAPTAN